jgi:hypothetical protein
LFARRVPKTDHQNGPTFPWVSVSVLARVENVTSVLIHSRPGWAHRDSGATGCDHYVGGPPGPLARGRFPRPVHPLHSIHCLTEVRPQSEVLLVELQVLDNLISSGITRPTLGHWQAGQRRETLRSVQMETVVVPAPRCRNNVLGFYDLEGFIRSQIHFRCTLLQQRVTSPAEERQATLLHARSSSKVPFHSFSGPLRRNHHSGPARSISTGTRTPAGSKPRIWP